MIDSYSALVTAVGNWLNRADLNARIPDFIQLAEARLNRILDDPEMDVSSTAAASDDFSALPDDFGGIVSVSTGSGTLSKVGPTQIAAYSGETGDPRYYALVGSTIAFAPRNDAVTIDLVYRRRVPPLTTTDTTNWLLELAPDVYLFSVLLQGAVYTDDTERTAKWKAGLDEALAELRKDGARRRWGSGPARPRMGRP